jgi:hypothetical protein
MIGGMVLMLVSLTWEAVYEAFERLPSWEATGDFSGEIESQQPLLGERKVTMPGSISPATAAAPRVPTESKRSPSSLRPDRGLTRAMLDPGARMTDRALRLLIVT